MATLGDKIRELSEGTTTKKRRTLGDLVRGQREGAGIDPSLREPTEPRRIPELERETTTIDLSAPGGFDPELAAKFEDAKKPKKETLAERLVSPLTALPKFLESQFEKMGAKKGVVTSEIKGAGLGALRATPIFGKGIVPDVELEQARRETQPFKLPEKLPFVGGKDVSSVDVGRIAGTLGWTAAQYGAVNKALQGLNTTSKLGSLLGTSKLAKFGATQGADLLADVIIQTPAEIVDAIQTDASLGEFAKTTLINRGIDVAMNLAIGGSVEGINALRRLKGVPESAKAVDNAIAKLPDDQAKTIQQELGLPEGTTAKEAPIKSIAEDISPEDLGTFKIDLEDAKTFDRQIREIIEPDITLPKTTDELVKEGLGFKVTEPVRAKNLEEVIVRSPNLKDIGVTERWTTDVFRNFEKVFGDDIGIMKRDILDPFDAAKKARVEDEILLTDNLKKDIVDKLGIKKNSKESALVQQFGEKRITLDELKVKSPDKWSEIVEADSWFRQQYDELIDGINAPRIAQGKNPIPKLDDYYRHFNEMGDTFQGIKNVFETNRQISPKLEGLSEFTKPGEKWASFKQKRTGQGAFKDDAVGGFLEYVKAGTYAKHIDPEIPKFRNLKNSLAESTEGTKNINHFIEFLDEYANGLSGKTGFLDRPFQKLVGRKTTAILNLLNSRMKSNAVLGNASSALSQIANVPQGLAHVKNPKHIAGGLDGYFKSLGGGGDKALYEQSGFLKERLTDSFSQFDTRIRDQPKKLAQWMLGALDETGTKFIWSMEYRKAVADGVPNPIKQADDITRKMVAGRGIGEVPELQRQKLFQLVAPFTLEVGNLWKVQKDFLKKKDFAALAILYGSNFLLNNALEDIRGSRVTFDPIDAIQQGINESEGLGDAIFNVPGRLAGEVLGNIPTGQAAAQLFPEFAKKTDISIPEKLQPFLPSAIKTEEGQLRIPSREDIFGETDPTRFGTDLPITRALSKPISSFLLPFGGQQIRKTKEGAEALGLLPKIEKGKFKFPEVPSARTKSDKLISPVKPTFESISKGLIFGKSAIPEVKAYYESGKAPFGEKQTESFDKLMESRLYKPDELFTALKEAKTFTTKEERVRVLSKTYSGNRLKKVLEVFFNYK